PPGTRCAARPSMKASTSSRPSAPPALQFGGRPEIETCGCGEFGRLATIRSNRRPVTGRHMSPWKNSALSWPSPASSRLEASMASSSMSMPHTEAAPSAPSTASTTPLPDPISNTCLPRTFSGSFRRAWISADVYSLGRSAFTGTRNAMSDASFIPPPPSLHPSALRQTFYHDLRHRIVRKLAEHRAIALQRAFTVAPQQRRMRDPRELGQPLGLRAGLELRTSPSRAQQLVDRHQAAPALDRDLVDGTYAEILARFPKGGVADADGGAELLVHALQTRRNVHAVAQHGVAHAFARADIADQH